jgi:uncharacterized protein with PIN domain
MPDEKDRLGEKLHQKEKAEEDRFYAERDKALIEKLRREKAAEQSRQAAEAVRMRCPKCGEHLVAVEHLGVTVDECPKRHGMWVDDRQLETLARREHDSWIGRFFYRPKL